ncbi:hypothetical protein SESBI_35943 [Sesbania bispinosa]|nr:hypothetical protein SESBI_35943 [Sesbania bispinosa]
MLGQKRCLGLYDGCEARPGDVAAGTDDGSLHAASRLGTARMGRDWPRLAAARWHAATTRRCRPDTVGVEMTTVLHGDGCSRGLSSGRYERWLLGEEGPVGYGVAEGQERPNRGGGGYSITLHPPGPGVHAPWFTKATMQRFFI